MNSFCNTVYVIVLLLRRREAGQKGENESARGTMGRGKRGREAFSHFPSSTARLIFLLYGITVITCISKILLVYSIASPPFWVF